MRNRAFASALACVTLVDAETRDIRFKLPQRGQTGKLAELLPPALALKVTAMLGSLQRWKLN